MFLENINSRTLFIIGVAIVILIVAKIIGKAVKLCIVLVITIIILSFAGVFASDSLFSSKILDTDSCLCIGDSTDRSVLCGILNTAASDLSEIKVIDSKCVSKEDVLQKGIVKESCVILSISGLGEAKRISYTFCEREKEN